MHKNPYSCSVCDSRVVGSNCYPHTHTQLHTYSGNKSQRFNFPLRHKLRPTSIQTHSTVDTFKWKHPLSGIKGSVLLCIITISQNKYYTTSFTQSSGLLSVSIMTSHANAKSFMHRCECAHKLPQDTPSLHTDLSFFPLFPLAMCNSKLHLFGPALIFFTPICIHAVCLAKPQTLEGT